MTGMNDRQAHLNHVDTVNLGSYYTPAHIVDLAYAILKSNVEGLNGHALLDSSCGYGSFLQFAGVKRRIGADIDRRAVQQAGRLVSDVKFVHQNSLSDVSRKNLTLRAWDKLIVVGNPPYNDTTSIIRNSIKDSSVSDAVDPDVKTRDLGMSFLLSYNKLKASYVCVLHPLSYLIKKANFALLADFAKNYKLIDGVIISSHEFPTTSRGMAFPILIALYKRDAGGMTHEHVRDYRFKIKDGGHFRLNDFDTVANYVQKYPNKRHLTEKDRPVARFWTLRDINALKRNRTFIDFDSESAVHVLKEKFPYYCYIDVFKQYADSMP
jgi:hypothetical protein